ncbi:PAS domain-containing sensor histidine kinase [Aquimarina spongiae]|uniref:histidine kinase n=1 Tax=Aquimarina spongiae TaxID=570521 RepID=A0A1M6GP53_9FLAO|nr:ATP-binding protein [Aquimarina spongiae]SHJ11761.1 Histidine kinase-, DNA gyrase B-, and HSP90-like ATPase [Aquimarina spongiae]
MAFRNNISSHLDSAEFLKSLIERSDSIISYFTPIFETNQIVDFNLDYITANFDKYINDHVDTITNKLVSTVFPIIFENGIFEIYQACFYKEGFEITYEREFNFGNKKVWFESKAIKQGNGITVTSKDITQLKSTESKLRDSLKNLEFQNTILNDSESISKTASFRWNIKKNIWMFSDNINRLFDYDQDSDQFKTDGFFNFLNDHKKRELKAKINALQYEDVLPPFEFSIESKIKKIRSFYLTAHFIPSKDGQMMLGVVQDVTEIIESQQLLRQKNEELLKINEELDSFNHIASHDLQEPLRKIRMFISRIQGMDATSFPKDSLKYLEKINLSATRMQELILHLLTYSRIGKKLIPFEKLSLDHILKESLIEFEEDIQKENIDLKIQRLPDITGIPFLVKQLFINLISNAIKFRKTNTPHKVSIFYTIINLPGETSENGNFHEVTIEDNGIGFDPKHKTSIFKLFNRLHEKTEYHGTGIGLAICKKIMDSHNGFITANSEPNNGSEFKMYFPIVKHLGITN